MSPQTASLVRNPIPARTQNEIYSFKFLKNTQDRHLETVTVAQLKAGLRPALGAQAIDRY
jgi:hypothetical protein